MRGEGKEPRMRSHSSRRGGGVEARVNALKPYSVKGGKEVSLKHRC